jgi:aminoglycoside phosphotransferase (APT) family kinase protein
MSDAHQTELAARVAKALGLTSVDLVAVPAGASNAAYRVMAPGGEAVAFLRAAGPGADQTNNPAKGLVHEGELLRRVHALGFTVPKVLAILHDPAAVIMELVPGTSRPDAASAEAVAEDMMGQLARLHTIPPAQLGLESQATVGEAVRQNFEHWVSIAEERGVTRSPLARLAIRVLRHAMPGGSEPPATLHGDVGPGNFMVHEGKLSAILDWELAHAGDVHEDLAWLWVRGVHTEFGLPATRLAEYERAAGRALDRQRLDWQIACTTFMSVIGMGGRLNFSGDDPSLLTIYLGVLAYEALLAAALAKVAGFHLPLLDEEPVSDPSVLARLAERAGVALQTATPAAPKETQIILRHLADHARQAPWRARRLEEDARAELNVSSAELGTLVDNAEPRQFRALIRVLGRDASRAVRALPNSERRVRRGLGIGLGN